MKHDWLWAGHGTRPLFGNPDNPQVVDFWTCRNCGKEITLAGHMGGPKDGKCKGAK